MSALIVPFPIHRTGSVWPPGLSDQEIADALNVGLVVPLIRPRLVAMWRQDVAPLPRWVADALRHLGRSVG